MHLVFVLFFAAKFCTDRLFADSLKLRADAVLLEWLTVSDALRRTCLLRFLPYNAGKPIPASEVLKSAAGTSTQPLASSASGVVALLGGHSAASAEALGEFDTCVG